MKKVWETIWEILKLTGFLLVVAVGGWAVWKYWLRNLFSTNVPTDISVGVENPQKDADAKKADTIEARLNRLLNSGK
jgi:predicted negative regulator of RcsB-dependent stress response